MRCSTVLLSLCLAFLSCACIAKPIALIGGTLIDVSHYGESSRDVDNATVIVDGDRIIAVESGPGVVVPANAERVDVTGQFLVPGLIDGFGAIKTQGFANAWLYNGVTTVSVNTADTRRGLRIFLGDPSPRIFTCEPVDGYSANGYEVDGDNSDRLPGDIQDWLRID